MTVPVHLQHKPILAVDDYDRIDGQYAPNTDARVLSIGQAQYDENEISAKVFRHTGNNWSRQSEELPIHRTLDLAILVVASMLSNNDGQESISNLNEKLVSPDRRQELLDYYQDNQNILRPRLQELQRLLNILL